jgi:hypothetical protein
MGWIDLYESGSRVYQMYSFNNATDSSAFCKEDEDRRAGRNLTALEREDIIRFLG